MVLLCCMFDAELYLLPQCKPYIEHRTKVKYELLTPKVWLGDIWGDFVYESQDDVILLIFTPMGLGQSNFLFQLSIAVIG